MKESKQLGIYWGPYAFSLVETQKGAIVQHATKPYDAPLEGNLANEQSGDIPEELRIATLIQNILKEKSITSKKIHMAIPAKDLIIRTFIIPWMQLNEVKNVVEFEVTKYIPIKLEELAFTYHPVAITENNQKSYLIVFVAVRKNILDRYTGILSNCGLTVEHIEPAAVSVGRLMSNRGKISKNHSTAIIEMDKGDGKIIIYDQGVVQFIREFRQPLEQSAEDYQAKLFNDIRVSFDFFKRQNPVGKIEHIELIGLQDISPIAKGLSTELNITAKAITAQDLLKIDPEENLGLLSALGVSSRDRKFSSRDLDLSDKTPKTTGFEGALQMINFKLLAGTVSGCLLAIFGSIYLQAQMVAGGNQRLGELTEQVGVYGSSTASQIKELHETKNAKLQAYKDIRIKSDVHNLMTRIPELLPEGAWLRGFDITYPGPAGAPSDKIKVNLKLDGYVYLDDVNDQFRLVNNLITRLKEDEDFKERFSLINLVSVRQQKLEQYNVTFFKIECR